MNFTHNCLILRTNFDITDSISGEKLSSATVMTHESNFFKYFAMNFNHLGLKKLICTCYASSPVVYTHMSFFGEEEVVGTSDNNHKPYKIEITEVTDLNGDGAVDLTDVDLLLQSVDGKPELLR